MLFVNFMAYRATLKNRVIYSEYATLYKYVLINKYINKYVFSQQPHVGA